MATRTDHLEASRSNEGTAERLVGLDEYGWAITCLFYAALHLVEAHLAERGGSVTSHHGRETVMRADRDLHAIQRYYTRLKRESENHRYRCYAFNAGEFRRVRTILYTPLADHMRSLLGAN